MKIVVVVPVYKEPKFLLDIAGKVRADEHADKELVVVVDGAMTAEIAEAIRGLDGFGSVVFPDEHLGKAEALNRAVAGIRTDALLFLDNDIELPSDPRFLARLSRAMDGNDIVDLPKEVIVESFYSAMIGYEYQSLAFTSFLFARFAGRSPGVIGSAFAVRKELFDRLGGFKKVVHEDGDFGARAFRLHARYRYDLGLKVRTSMPNDFPDWFRQRKRWTLINVLWFKDNFLFLLKSVFVQPSLLPTLLFIVLPSLLSFLVFFLMSVLDFPYAAPAFFMLEHPFQLSAGAFLWLSHHALLSDGLAGTGIGFLVALATYGAFAVFSRFRFNIATFLVYYFLYLPVVVVLNVVMFAALLGAARIRLDWKV